MNVLSNTGTCSDVCEEQITCQKDEKARGEELFSAITGTESLLLHESRRRLLQVQVYEPQTEALFSSQNVLNGGFDKMTLLQMHGPL